MDHQTLSSTSILQEDDLQASLFKMVANAAYIINSNGSSISSEVSDEFLLRWKFCFQLLEMGAIPTSNDMYGRAYLNNNQEK